LPRSTASAAIPSIKYSVVEVKSLHPAVETMKKAVRVTQMCWERLGVRRL
jgi:hypothetical protein